MSKINVEWVDISKSKSTTEVNTVEPSSKSPPIKTTSSKSLRPRKKNIQEDTIKEIVDDLKVEPEKIDLSNVEEVEQKETEKPFNVDDYIKSKLNAKKPSVMANKQIEPMKKPKVRKFDFTYHNPLDQVFDNKLLLIGGVAGLLILSQKLV